MMLYIEIFNLALSMRKQIQQIFNLIFLLNQFLGELIVHVEF